MRAKGWSPRRTSGSHTNWRCPSAQHSVSVPDGHRMISPGVLRKVLRTLDACDCKEKQ